MATPFGLAPDTQPITSVNLGNFLVGVSKVILGGTWVGLIKEATGVALGLNAQYKDIRSGYHAGTRLGRLNIGMSPELKFSAVEGSLENLKLFLDPRGGVSPGRRLNLGLMQPVATEHTAQVYSTGPQQRVRRLNLYRVTVRIDDDINWAHPEDETEFPLVLEVLPNLTLGEADWFGDVTDMTPA